MKIYFTSSLLLLSLFAGLPVVGQTVLMNEDFISGSQPFGWSQDSAGVTPFFTWTYNNPGNRSITGAGFDTHFVIFDSDHYGTGNSQNCYLNLSEVNASSLTSLYLIMDEQHRAYTGQWHQIEVSVDSGITWMALLTDSVSDVGFPTSVHSIYDISSIASGHASVRIRFHMVAVWGWWWAIDNIIITDSRCTSPPPVGATLSTMTYACPADSFNLSLMNDFVGYGLSYQWQSSANGFGWSNITGAVDSVFRTIQSVPTYYRCALSCASFMHYSDSVRVFVNPNPVCYCIPYNYICTGTDYISNVKIVSSSFNNSSHCDSLFPTSYSYFAPATGTTDTLFVGVTYKFSVTTNNNDIISLWIDYDHSGTFDANEWTQVCTTSVSGVADTVSVTIPFSALTGQTGMRVRSRSAGNLNNGTFACEIAGSGEIEDYLITIEQGVGVNEQAFQSVSVFPSPTHGIVEINFGNHLRDKSLLKIYDITGNLLIDKMTDASTPAFLDLSDLNNGIYFLKIETAAGSTTRKVVLFK